ncbi:MAG: potassium transporter TrkA, partial [Candidatus Krumholzibacteria bacterium]|nr:potassium transporter TrkA [Candidatus Krumholzibacteria bacterium]
MKKITFSNHVRYKFDSIMSRGQIALIGLLLFLTVVVIGIFALLLLALGGKPQEWEGGHLFWQLLLRTIDPGTMAGDEGGWLFLFLMLAVTLGGIFIFSTLIGLLTTGIEDTLAQFRKGRSFVAEENHIVILGWSSMIFTIVRQLAFANSGRKGLCITILAKKDKVEMEDAIATKVDDLGKSRLVCRSGNPIVLADLEIVNPYAARSIIILGPEEGNPDVRVIKTILALTNSPNRQSAPFQITAVMRHLNNLEAARVVGKDEVQLLLSADILAGIAAQVCSESGLSLVYEELLDFRGNDVHFVEEPALAGQPFDHYLLAFENATLLGLRSKNRDVRLHPPGDTIVAPDDAFILLAADKHSIQAIDIRQIP